MSIKTAIMAIFIIFSLAFFIDARNNQCKDHQTFSFMLKVYKCF